MNAGSITWAPVSPPAVVVLARSSDGMQLAERDQGDPGHRDQVRPRRPRPPPGEPPTAGSSGSTGAGARPPRAPGRPGPRRRARSSQKNTRAPRASGTTTAARAVRLKVAWATMFMPRRPVRYETNDRMIPKTARPSSWRDSAWARPKSTPVIDDGQRRPHPTADRAEQPGQRSGAARPGRTAPRRTGRPPRCRWRSRCSRRRANPRSAAGSGRRTAG